MEVLAILLLLQLVLTDATTTINFDLTQSVLASQLVMLQSVEKVVDVKYLFNLINGHRWTQFPDMNIVFNLTYAQRVQFAYTINIGASANNCWMATRLEIDGKEERFFRGHQGAIYSHQFSRTGSVYLDKGEHRAIVWYRCDCNTIANDPVGVDWPVGVFKVHYHQLRQTN